MEHRQLALLRGINVGGKHIIPMPALAAVFVDLGCTEVRTYIQSGNVVFSPPALGLSSADVAQAIEAHAGFRVPVVLRSKSQLAKVIANNPFATRTDINPALLHAVFLASPLSANQILQLNGLIAGDEQLAAHGNELYLSLPHGAGRSKLASACIAPKLPPTNTMRNWVTVLKLAELLAS